MNVRIRVSFPAVFICRQYAQQRAEVTLAMTFHTGLRNKSRRGHDVYHHGSAFQREVAPQNPELQVEAADSQK
jgi:hypothetical protein